MNMIVLTNMLNERITDVNIEATRKLMYFVTSGFYGASKKQWELLHALKNFSVEHELDDIKYVTFEGETCHDSLMIYIISLKMVTYY